MTVCSFGTCSETVFDRKCLFDLFIKMFWQRLSIINLDKECFFATMRIVYDTKGTFNVLTNYIPSIASAILRMNSCAFLHFIVFFDQKAHTIAQALFFERGCNTRDFLFCWMVYRMEQNVSEI